VKLDPFGPAEYLGAISDLDQSNEWPRSMVSLVLLSASARAYLYLPVAPGTVRPLNQRIRTDSRERLARPLFCSGCAADLGSLIGS
jgi:hypothetical protein